MKFSNMTARSYAIGAVCLFALLALLPASQATEFPVIGGQGDRAEQLRCPDGYVLVGFVGRVGNWIDQISPMCSELLRPAYVTGGVVVPPPRGGNGGTPVSQYCERDAAVRAITFEYLFKYNYSERPDYIFNIDFNCVRPKDGQSTGGRTFGGTRLDATDLSVSNPMTQQCPDSEYASGISIHYGKHVNAIGLICSRFEFDAPPPPPPPATPAPAPAPAPEKPIKHVGPLPSQLMTGMFDTDFGVLALTPNGGTYTYLNGRVTPTSVHQYFMEGTWQQDKSSQKCSDGTFHGTFFFQFTLDGFTGYYGICEGPPTTGNWNGKRKSPIQ